MKRKEDGEEEEEDREEEVKDEAWGRPSRQRRK